jgi:hypothetical protein
MKFMRLLTFGTVMLMANGAAAGWDDVLRKLTVTVSSSPAEVEKQKPVAGELLFRQ